MRLRAKAILILVGTLSMLGLLSITFFLLVIRPSFIEIEKKEAVKDMQRVLFAIQNEIDHLDIFNSDWSLWDASYEFMLTHSEEYIKENLPISTFVGNYLNIIHYYNVKGELIWGEAHDLETEELIDIKDFSGDRLPEDHLLFKFAFDKSPLLEVAIKGLFMTELGPMLVSSRPILTSNGEGPSRGAIVMGRFLTNDVVEKLKQQVNVEFNVLTIEPDSSFKYLQNILQNLSPKKPFYIDTNNATQMEIFASSPDLKGDDSQLLIRVYREREIFAESQIVMRYSIVSIVLSIFIGFVLLSILMQKIVIGPINNLSRHALAIRRSGDLSSQLTVHSHDEVGILTEEFNTMMTQLHKMKHELQEQSFNLGMAELASGVLHNLRNSLHIMFSNIEKTYKTIEKIPVEKITMARQELRSIAESEERKADLIDFLDSTNESLLVFISRTKEQMDNTVSLGTEVENILHSFEKWAYKERVDEQILLERLIQESYLFLQNNYRDAISFIVESGVKDISHIKANRIILLQILINLFTNATESINRTKEKRGEIHIHADIEDMDSRPAVHIRISDNGAGMERDVLHNIFARGFTTKSEGHTGIGLHWCFNAVMSMNGKLYAESKGEGQGACLHLLLPINTGS